MYNKVKYEKVAKNIWKVIRWTKNDDVNIKTDSLFVRTCKKYEKNNSRCECIEENGLLQFFLNGKKVISEKISPFTQSFEIGENEALYGLGIHQNSPLNRRNGVYQMLQINGEVTAVPFITSTGGYALLFDNTSYMSIGIDKPCAKEIVERFNTDEEDKNSINIFYAGNEPFIYYIILAEDISEQIKGYRFLTGKSPMYPKWAYGFFQSREHYKTQEELLSIVKTFRENHIPLDCIVQDWNYWGDYGWNALVWDEKKYPSPKKAIEEIHGMDCSIMISVWPSFGPNTEICRKLEKVDGILEKPNRKGEEKFGRVHDPLNNKAADLIWKEMKKNFFDYGIDAWWLDSTEPAFETDSSINLLECKDCKKGKNLNYLNCYALNYSKNVYTRQRAESNLKRVFILTRSGYAGQQKYAASTWTGDIKAEWGIFKKQLTALLSFSMSGIPYSTTDIGGFFVLFENGNRNEEYKELYTRWFFFGAFSPLFRSHGTSTPREMWFFGEPKTKYFDAQMEASRLRYTLMPYIYKTAFDVYKNDDVFISPLAKDFPFDFKVTNMSDEYIFGKDILVKIITDYQVYSTDVYLPEGREWIDYHTKKRYCGGTTVRVDTPLNKIPIFIKSGSIIVTAPYAECTALQKEDELTINVVSGEDGVSFYYKDGGNDYSYEKGNYLKIPLKWKEKSSVLIIGDVEKNKSELDVPTTLHITLDGEYLKTVNYNGKKIVERLRKN